MVQLAGDVRASQWAGNQRTQKPQRAALELVAAVLSKEGYQKAIDIMNADDQLVKDKDNKMKFGTEHFYIALFGAPSTTKPWMMQFGGHHLGINVTMMGKDAVVTPTHTGAQPDSFQRDGKTVRPLGTENDLAFKLVNMLNAEQKKQVVLGAKPKNLVLGPKEDNKKSDPEGIKCSALDKDQRAVLMDVIALWVNILPADAAARRKADIEKKLDDTHFVWYGPTTNGSAAYYKIQGPNVHIEYAPQGASVTFTRSLRSEQRLWQGVDQTQLKLHWRAEALGPGECDASPALRARLST